MRVALRTAILIAALPLFYLLAIGLGIDPQRARGRCSHGTE